MKIMITGDKGFVGIETKKVLEEEKHLVIGYDLMDGYDIRDLEQLDGFVGTFEPDRILHLAAIARFDDADKDPKLAFETNSLGTKNVAKVAGKHHVPVVYASTGSVYMPIIDEPPITEDFRACGNSVYACSKYTGELYIKSIASPYIILRYAHIYGKEKRNSGLIGNFMSRIERGLAPIMYGGKQSSDFVHVTDVAWANKVALEASWDKWNDVYNIGTGEEITTEKASELICAVAGWNGGVDCRSPRSVDAPRFVYNCEKSIKKLNFKAIISFEEGLRRIFGKKQD